MATSAATRGDDGSIRGSKKNGTSNQRIGSGSGSSFVESLLLPAYADAGANTSFRPIEEAERQTLTPSPPASDATTEVRDNRSNHLTRTVQPSERQPQQQQNQKWDERKPHVPLRPKRSSSSSKIQQQQHDERIRASLLSRSGFFPTTKPPMLDEQNRYVQQQQQHHHHHHHQHNQSQQKPHPRHLSPASVPDSLPTLEPTSSRDDLCPQSPPLVSRRQLPAPSVAGTSMAGNIGSSEDLTNDVEYPDSEPNDVVVTRNHATDNDNDETHDKLEKKNHDKRYDDDGDDDDDVYIGDESRKLKNDVRNPSADDSDVGENESGTSKLTKAQLDLHSRGTDIDPPENDSQEGDSVSTSQSAMRNASLFERDSDMQSDINSNASEMGTVINLSSTRMADIEAMAALMEASPSYNIDLPPPVDEDHPYEDHHDIKIGNNLILPTLQGRSQSTDVAVPQSKLSPSRFRPTIRRDQAVFVLPKKCGSPDKKKIDAGAAAIVSATIRRIGSGLDSSTTRLKPLSAPSTPQSQHAGYRETSANYLPMAIDQPRRPYERRSPRRTSFGRSRSNNTSGSFGFTSRCFSFDSTQDDSVPLPLSKSFQDTTTTKCHPTIRKMRSWDEVGMSMTTTGIHLDANHNNNNQSAFRSGPTSRTGLFRATSTQQLHAQRARFSSDFSPSKSDSVELRTPQRIEMERADALDILSCLVERVVARHKEEVDNRKSKHGKSSVDEHREPNSDSRHAGENSKSELMVDTSHDSSLSVESSMRSAIDDLRQISKRSSGTNLSTNHGGRMRILDELLRSHAYAQEMKQAALSASTWLQSVRNGSFDSGEHAPAFFPEGTTISGQTSGEEDRNESSPPPPDKVVLTTLKALLHSAQMEAKEKTEMNERLNQELSECRAEIGRLKSASRAETPLCPNHSILDDPEESSNSSTPLADENTAVPNAPTLITNSLSVDSDMRAPTADPSFSKASGREADPNVIVMKAALEQANAIIQRLHKELLKVSPDNGAGPPLVSIPEIVSPTEPDYNDENQMVNVRMLDGENFITDWSDLIPPLPPPPDHGLQSPIVNAVLDQWSSDRSLHYSLLTWMERVMVGDDLESVPPLTISSLDHQVRDGFSMHVLPLILRRSDIRVDVQTRAHRRTTYDLAVTVSPVFVQSSNRVDDWSATHSAVTAHITNAHRTTYSQSGLLTRSSSRDSNDLPQPTAQSFMGALGGALNGLLSRRKYAVPSSHQNGGGGGSPTRILYEPDADGTSSHASSYAISGANYGDDSYRHDYVDDDEHENDVSTSSPDQPYHRVVSAPPGRIGVTLVEFRGHAMVSDVSPTSPLSGWVFPSDILIAIDEIPVSGMRVRDVISVLKTRNHRQRALRVISSHDMNEFTNAHSQISDDGEAS